jgi:hypothetical protein
VCVDGYEIVKVWEWLSLFDYTLYQLHYNTHHFYTTLHYTTLHYSTLPQEEAHRLIPQFTYMLRLYTNISKIVWDHDPALQVCVCVVYVYSVNSV